MQQMEPFQQAIVDSLRYAVNSVSLDVHEAIKQSKQQKNVYKSGYMLNMDNNRILLAFYTEEGGGTTHGECHEVGYGEIIDCKYLDFKDFPDCENAYCITVQSGADAKIQNTVIVPEKSFGKAPLIDYLMRAGIVITAKSSNSKLAEQFKRYLLNKYKGIIPVEKVQYHRRWENNKLLYSTNPGKDTPFLRNYLCNGSKNAFSWIMKMLRGTDKILLFAFSAYIFLYELFFDRGLKLSKFLQANDNVLKIIQVISGSQKLQFLAIVIKTH